MVRMNDGVPAPAADQPPVDREGEGARDEERRS
jgi:hypothetical protein